MAHLAAAASEPGRSPTDQMLAPLVLPFQITVAVFVTFWCVGALTLRTPKRIALLSVASVLLFIPSCVGVTALVDSQRYGRFNYALASEIPDDGYIELPAHAAEVTIYRNAAGHWARFTISTPSLRSWIDERRSLRPDLNPQHDEDEWAANGGDAQPPDLLERNQQVFRSRFPDTGWTYGPSMLEMHVSRSDRGGGYTVWHVPTTGDTYLSAGYW